MKLSPAFEDRLRDFKAQKGMSFKNMALEIGIPKSTFYRIMEKGEVGFRSLKKIELFLLNVEDARRLINQTMVIDLEKPSYGGLANIMEELTPSFHHIPFIPEIDAVDDPFFVF